MRNAICRWVRGRPAPRSGNVEPQEETEETATEEANAVPGRGLESGGQVPQGSLLLEWAQGPGAVPSSALQGKPTQTGKPQEVPALIDRGSH